MKVKISCNKLKASKDSPARSHGKYLYVNYGCIVSLFSINGAKWGISLPISKSNTMHWASNAEGDTARSNAETMVTGRWVWKVTHLLNMVEVLFCAFNTSGPISVVEVACSDLTYCRYEIWGGKRNIVKLHYRGWNESTTRTTTWYTVLRILCTHLSYIWLYRIVIWRNSPLRGWMTMKHDLTWHLNTIIIMSLYVNLLLVKCSHIWMQISFKM